MSKPLKFSDQIRRAIDESGMTRYGICKHLEFSESVMSKFMKGKSGLSITTLDRLAELLGMKIATPEATRKRQRTSPRKPKRPVRKTKG